MASFRSIVLILVILLRASAPLREIICGTCGAFSIELELVIMFVECLNAASDLARLALETRGASTSEGPTTNDR